MYQNVQKNEYLELHIFYPLLNFASRFLINSRKRPLQLHNSTFSR